MDNCVFCKIAKGEIPSKKVYEEDSVLAFYDLSPQAPSHVLIIPKAHAEGLNDLADLPDSTLAALLRAATQVAKHEGIEKTGYRMISNCGPDACQSVGHLHFHVLGGKQLGERMD